MMGQVCTIMGIHFRRLDRDAPIECQAFPLHRGTGRISAGDSFWRVLSVGRLKSAFTKTRVAG